MVIYKEKFSKKKYYSLGFDKTLNMNYDDIINFLSDDHAKMSFYYEDFYISIDNENRKLFVNNTIL